ncbi:hypothetical protein QQS21_012443 [Conoideocrella luteorostrata]|uniref:C6 transcription factor n=1 Tax=Conoideocrella luteorostrata TaxID=1105319 RepID=A0AAJ0CE11_9HYPO|nr:hypothetical protein QQS21_012443 [Conoideocrella luteorostrata]
MAKSSPGARLASEPPRLLAVETRERRYREMRLLHYFTVAVCPTFPGVYLDEVRKIWSVDVPVMAMDYEPLLNAMMGLAILHMTYTDNTSGLLHQHQLLSHGAEYLEATLQEHRKALDSLDRKNADPASFTSVILSFHAFASLRERPIQPYHPPLQWLQMSKGVQNVFKITRRFVQDDPKAKINIINASSASFVEPSVIFCEANRNRFPYLLASQPKDSISEEDREVYVDTVCFLGALLGGKEAGEPISQTCRRLIIYPIVWSTRFLELLDSLRPRALLILAHFFGLASTCSDSWWVGDSPRREVLAIEKYLGTEWQSEMAWPLEAIRNSTTPGGLETTS